jgi:hypothetical protein
VDHVEGHVIRDADAHTIAATRLHNGGKSRPLPALAFPAAPHGSAHKKFEPLAVERGKLLEFDHVDSPLT